MAGAAPRPATALVAGVRTGQVVTADAGALRAVEQAAHLTAQPLGLGGGGLEREAGVAELGADEAELVGEGGDVGGQQRRLAAST